MGPDNAPGMARLAGERSQNASEMAGRLVIEIEGGRRSLVRQPGLAQAFDEDVHN